MIFPLVEAEPIVQVLDKTRISAVKTFISKDEAAITLVEIEPEASAGFIAVTGSAPINSKNWFLDWAYATSGTKTITLRVTTNATPVTFTKTISVIAEADDKLWSNDSDLQVMEPDILGWVKQGRATFKDYHRMSQTRILEWLDNLKVWNIDGERFTKDTIDLAIALDDLKRISTYWCLELIFDGLYNKTDDVFKQKADAYRKTRRELCADRSRIRVDYDKSGTVDKGEEFKMREVRLYR